METKELSAYRRRAERRRRVRGTGELRGDGWVRTEADEQLLTLATRYSTLTLRQAAMACWRGQVETARTRVRLMTEAGLLHRSAEAPWAGTTVWTSERGVPFGARSRQAGRHRRRPGPRPVEKVLASLRAKGFLNQLTPGTRPNALARKSRTVVAKPSGSACWTKWSVPRER